MPKRLDLTGQRFGNLTVIKFHDVRHGMSRWECKCDCGNNTIVYGRHMISGNTQSCGCLGMERRKQACTKHNLSHTRIYTIWADMKDRCYNPHNAAYKWYGEKGITVCDEWLHNPSEFAIWAMVNGYTDELTIDRIDANKNYSPDNCRWVTQKENLRNMFLANAKNYWANNLETGEHFEFKIIKDFAEEHGLNSRTICSIYRGGKAELPGLEFGVSA